jgi:hypothetical protein
VPRPALDADVAGRLWDVSETLAVVDFNGTVEEART